jgi:Fe-S cluster biogenesis protein NfuA
MNNGEFQAHTEKVEQLLQQVNGFCDENARATAVELMQTLMDLQGAVMSRLVEVLSESGESGRNALSKVADDPLICGMLVLYGIHPLSLEERVLRAIEKLRPQVQTLGTRLELVSAADSEVRIHVQCSHSDANSAATVRSKIEQAIREAAPEVAEIAIEGLLPSGFVPLNMIQPVSQNMKQEKRYEVPAA